MPSLLTRLKRHPFPVVAHFERVGTCAGRARMKMRLKTQAEWVEK